MEDDYDHRYPSLIQEILDMENREEYYERIGINLYGAVNGKIESPDDIQELVD